MAIRRYTVTIETPEAEDDYDFTTTIERHGEVIGTVIATMLNSQRQIGEVIMTDVESEL